ncbi:MAG TPA: VOC family protein [Actinomycetota bacterium]|nr:VOC family protein [Actinomycetota bacterium]
MATRIQVTIDCADPNPLAARRERVDAEADRLVAAGATRFRVLSEEAVDHYAVVMRDPEGNEFCVVEQR